MYEVFADAFVDTVKMVPLLLLVYIGIEYIEYKYGHQIGAKISKTGKAGPLLGASFGCVPQCGFSVISTALYTKGLISTGTLMAVYLSTSDEAIPIILAQPEKAGVLLPLLITKVVVALIAGFSIDYITGRLGNPLVKSETCATYDEFNESENSLKVVAGTCVHQAEQFLTEKGCCGHTPSSAKPNYKEVFLHPIVHTLKIFVFIFAVSVIINTIVFKVGEENLAGLLLGNSLLQPLAAALVGLIPNCAASIAITQVFLMGGIGFGAAVAGLSASAGLGILVLFRENRSLADSLRIVGMLYGISAMTGILIQIFHE